jgi:VanZ family protein
MGRTVLAFYDPSNAPAFSMHQDNTTLVLQLGNRGEMNRGFRQMAVEDVFRKQKILLTVAADGRETAIYLNGQLVAKNKSFGLTARDLSGQLILANSPLRGDSWSGKLRGMAIYPSVFSPSEVAQSYKDWTEGRESPLALSRRAVAFYTFREHGGRIIHDIGTSRIDLYIPERFLVVDQLLLEPPWSEVRTSHSYVRDGIINVEGFIPLGFLLTTYFAAVRQIKRPALVAIVVGGSLSVTIEIFQAYLPTRFSGCTDIITNTLGTALGAALYYRFATSIRKRLAVPDR